MLRLSPLRWFVILIAILAVGMALPIVLMNVGGGAGKLTTVTYTAP